MHILWNILYVAIPSVLQALVGSYIVQFLATGNMDLLGHAWGDLLTQLTKVYNTMINFIDWTTYLLTFYNHFFQNTYNRQPIAQICWWDKGVFGELILIDMYVLS